MKRIPQVIHCCTRHSAGQHKLVIIRMPRVPTKTRAPRGLASPGQCRMHIRPHCEQHLPDNCPRFWQSLFQASFKLSAYSVRDTIKSLAWPKFPTTFTDNVAHWVPPSQLVASALYFLISPAAATSDLEMGRLHWARSLALPIGGGEPRGYIPGRAPPNKKIFKTMAKLSGWF